MGLFTKLFKTKEDPIIKLYNLPDIIQNCTNNSPYLGKYSNYSVDNTVYLLYCDFSSANKWINDAKKPDSYFSNYIKSIQILHELNKYKRKFHFKSPTPEQQLDDLKNQYANNTNRFINNYWIATVEASNKLKTEKGKQNRLDKFFDTLLNEYKYYLLNENISFINTFKEQNTPKDIMIDKIAVTCKNYDVNTLEGIRAIPNNDFDVMRLLQKAATNHKRNGDINLAIECLKKSNSISDSVSENIGKLLPKEYLRLVNYIKLSGQDNLAIKEKNAIYKKHPEFFDKRISNKKRIADTISKAKEWNEDLVMVFTNKVCSICGTHDKKIYSISGKSLKYPKLPNEIINQTHNCKNCILAIHIYLEGINS